MQHGHETLDERRLLLLRGKHTFTRIGKSQQQQTHADHAIDDHGDGKAQLLIATTDQVDQRQSKHTRGNHADLTADITESICIDTFLGVGGEVRQQRGARRGHRDGEEIHHDVRYVHINHLDYAAEVRHRKRHDTYDGKWRTEPQEPWTHLASLGMRFINKRTHHRTCNRVKHTHHQEQRTDRQQANAGHVGVIEHHVRGDHVEHQIVRAIRRSIAELLLKGELNVRVVHNNSFVENPEQPVQYEPSCHSQQRDDNASYP